MSERLVSELMDPRFIGQEGMRGQAASEIKRLRVALRRIVDLCDAPRNSDFIRGQVYREAKDALQQTPGA